MIIFYFKTDCNLFFNFLLSLATSGGMEATKLLKVGEVLFGLKHLQTRMFREYWYVIRYLIIPTKWVPLLPWSLMQALEVTMLSKLERFYLGWNTCEHVCLENICIFLFDNSNKMSTFVTLECEAALEATTLSKLERFYLGWNTCKRICLENISILLFIW